MATIDTKTIVLPDLISTYPFKVECNPEYGAVSIETDAWLFGHGIPHTESTTKFNLLAALLFPHASRTRLRDACDACTLLIIADDLIDSSAANSISDQSKRRMFNNMMDSLQPAGAFKPLTSFASALHDWWQRILTNATPECQRRFITAYRDANEASLRQATNQKGLGTVPNLKTYIDTRRDSVFGYMVCALMEYALELHLKDEYLTNETLKNLLECMVDAGAWTNDVYSFNIEQSQGQYNLISVLMHANPLMSIQQAMDQAGQMIIDRYVDFERIRCQLPSWGIEIDVQIEKYVDGLAAVLSGNLCWSFETPRYFGAQKEEVKRTRCIKLLAPETIMHDNFTDWKKDQKLLAQFLLN